MKKSEKVGKSKGRRGKKKGHRWKKEGKDGEKREEDGKLWKTMENYGKQGKKENKGKQGKKGKKQNKERKKRKKGKKRKKENKKRREKTRTKEGRKQGPKKEENKDQRRKKTRTKHVKTRKTNKKNEKKNGKKNGKRNGKMLYPRPYLVKRTCPHCAHIIKKCSQVCFQLYICCDSHFGFKTSICHAISSASCYMLAERFGFGPIVVNGKRAALGAAHRLVMERQGIFLNASMQEGRARAEAGRRLSWALGEVGSGADAAMVTVTDGVQPNLMSGSFSPMMGCIETKTSGEPGQVRRSGLAGLEVHREDE